MSKEEMDALARARQERNKKIFKALVLVLKIVIFPWGMYCITRVDKLKAENKRLEKEIKRCKRVIHNKSIWSGVDGYAYCAELTEVKGVNGLSYYMNLPTVKGRFDDE